MIVRLNYYRFYLRLFCYILPLPAYLFTEWATTVYNGMLHRCIGYQALAHPGDILIATLIWVLAAEHYRVCNLDEVFRQRTGVRAVSKALGVTFAVLFVCLFLRRETELSRILVIGSAIVLWIATIVLHAGFSLQLHRRRSSNQHQMRVLVVGVDAFARKAAAQLRRVPFAPSSVMGFVQLEGQEIAVEETPVYQLDEIAEMREIPIDIIVIALPPTRFGSIPEIAHKLEPLCIPIRAVLGKDIFVRDHLFQFGSLQMLEVATTPADTVPYLVSKRVFDIVFASLAVVLTAVPMIAIAVAIKLTSSGPLLFKQTRVGLSGKLFTMYKFRTMKVLGEAESDTRWTTEQDDRRTMIGSFLRKSSLDELPQFFNVIKGHMSVVGPRPERPFFVKKFREEVANYNSRHRLKVGITGWAQVHGLRGNTSIQKRVEYDLYYLQNWSIWFDLRIIVSTVFVGFVGKNAY